ncbi:MAG: putative zinc-binding metallopeptidase [Gammaproteobacteria bacterium]|nr:putative zinc-binding metallopeptidase [Gammaproteobacteria bacterium]
MPARKQLKKSNHKFPWARLPRERLLDVRICDLGLTLEDTPVMRRINRLYKELDKQGLQFRPHFWLSDEWFCPDHVPGISIPFYLAHPRLQKLEREFIMEVEGADYRWCMKLLRHETAHAIANAYRLVERKDWRNIFGNPNSTYHDAYSPKPYSKRYVINLPGWYAQSHPHEDWAETFAVWLTPNSDWPHRYADWPALKKLRYVDHLMNEIRQKQPAIRNKRTDHPVNRIRATLREYYDDKMRRYGIDHAVFFDIDLQRLFETSDEAPRAVKASHYIRGVQNPLMEIVQRWTGEYKYRINEVLHDMIKRCDELDLRAGKNHKNMFPEITSCLTMLVMSKLHSGGFNITR